MNSIALRWPFVVVCVLALGAVPCRAAEKPPVAVEGEDTEKVRQAFNALLQQGTNALAAGETKAALDALLDARSLFEKRLKGKAMPVGSPEHVAVLHGLALGYQIVGKPEKATPLFAANSPLDRAFQAKSVSRQLVMTRAVLDFTQNFQVMRTAKGLIDYLNAHPDELDSEILDVTFTLLVKAEGTVTNRALALDPMIKVYEEFNKRLEATRPGERRWGVEWVSQGKFNVEMGNRKRAIAAYERAMETLADREADVTAAKRAVAQARLNGNMQAAQNRLSSAVSRRDSAWAAAEDAREKIPAVPVLGKTEIAKLLDPHETTVIVSAKKGAGGTAAGAEKAVAFTLGGSAPPTTMAPVPEKPVAVATNTPPSTPATFEPPPAAPVSRRSFSRSAAGFAVTPELILTSAAAVNGAGRVVLEVPNAQPIEATVERAGENGLALLRVKEGGKKFAYLNLATAFAGGPVQCPAFPEVSVFGVSVETLRGTAGAPRGETWKVALGKHPRLPGSPVLDGSGNLVGIELADRDDLTDRLPALGYEQIKAFLGEDAPKGPCINPGSALVVQVVASFER